MLRVNSRYRSFVEAFKLMDTISTKPARRGAVSLCQIRSESPFVLIRTGGFPWDLQWAATLSRTSNRSVGSPYPQKTISW